MTPEERKSVVTEVERILPHLARICRVSYFDVIDAMKDVVAKYDKDKR
jgi:hypothetical protein